MMESRRRFMEWVSIPGAPRAMLAGEVMEDGQVRVKFHLPDEADLDTLRANLDERDRVLTVGFGRAKPRRVNAEREVEVKRTPAEQQRQPEVRDWMQRLQEDADRRRKFAQQQAYRCPLPTPSDWPFGRLMDA